MAIQNSLDSICSASRRNCVRCGNDFFDFTAEGRSFACLHCRKPARKSYPIPIDQFGFPLSLRENQITDRVSEGKPNKQIAYELCLSVGTVKVFISHIFAKTGCKNRTQLAIWKLQKRDNPSQSA
jgi:DNA-binding NarL/FixJ family response regulator